MHLKSRGVLVALAVLAMSVLAVSAASAATLPEFKPVPTKKKFTSTSGTVSWTMGVGGTERITCSKSTATGEITGTRTVGKLVIKFSGCISASGCTMNSAGGKGGEVVTNALKGELGTVKTTEEPSGVGLLIETEAAKPKTWATLAGNECFPESKIAGNLAAGVAVTGKKQVTNTLVFNSVPRGEGIQSITLDSGTVVKPELVFAEWGNLTIASSDELKFEEALEVT
jgi:hypothetical protein